MRFTIRDLFLVTLIVALGLGWLVDRWSVASDLRELREENASLAFSLKIREEIFDHFSSDLVNHGFQLSLERDGSIEPIPMRNSSASAPNPSKP